MKIAFRDFVPSNTKEQKHTLIFSYSAYTYENFQTAVREANKWITASEIRVINLETVVMASSKPMDAQESDVTQHRINCEMPVNYHQFLRVWYEAK